MAVDQQPAKPEVATLLLTDIRGSVIGREKASEERLAPEFEQRLDRYFSELLEFLRTLPAPSTNQV